MKHFAAASVFGVFAMCALSCVGSTGGQLLEFTAAGAGTELSSAFTVQAAGGPYRVSLTRAVLKIEALYFTRVSTSGTERDTACYTADSAVVAEVRADLTLDALNPARQPFPEIGRGLSDRVRAADLWLGRGDISALTAESRTQAVVSVEGLAESAAGQFPFEGKITIDANRLKTPESTARPGSNPICQQRIIDAVQADFVLSSNATVTLRVDARRWFDDVDFRLLEKQANAPYRFADSAMSQPSIQLFNNVRKNRGVYTFEVQRAP
jgi:hypothetical protein